MTVPMVRIGQEGSPFGRVITAVAAHRLEEELDLPVGSVGKPVGAPLSRMTSSVVADTEEARDE